MRNRPLFFTLLATLTLSLLTATSLYAKSSGTLPMFQAAINAAGQLDLTVTKLGDGEGSVTSTNPGIACGNDCYEDYPYGTEVTLTAVPVIGDSSFAGWGGACSGTQLTCTVKIAKNTAVTATFQKRTLVREDGIWWGLHNGGRPTFYLTHYMKHYPPTFTLTMDGCETVVVVNNGHRFESSRVIVKQSDVGGRGTAVTTQSGQCYGSRSMHILYYKEDMPVDNPPVLIP